MASYKVTAITLPVRTSPGVTSQVIVELEEGAIVERIRYSTDRKWMEIRLQDGMTGWSSCSFLVSAE